MDRRTVLDLAVVNVLALIAAAVLLNGSLGEWGGDNVQYQLLARALASGEGYVDLHVVGTPPHVRYPPLFPVLLAPLVAWGAPLVALKGWVAFLSVAGLNAAYCVLTKTLDRRTALLAVLGTLGSGAFLDPALSVMSEGPYFLISVLALGSVQRSTTDGKPVRLAAFVSGVLIGAAILTRTVGVVLVAALLARAVFERRPSAPLRRRMAPTLVVAAVAVGVSAPWFVWSASHGGAGPATYAGEFAKNHPAAPPAAANQAERPGLLERVASRPGRNLRDAFGRLSEAPVVPAGGAAWFSGAFLALCGLVAAMTLVGLGRAVVVRGDIRDWYVAAYLAVLAVWVGGGFRLIMPILVFLFAYWYEGVVATWRVAGTFGLRSDPRTTGARARAAGTVALAAVAAASLAVTATFPRLHDRLLGRYATWWNDYLAAVTSLESIARPDDVVLSAPDNVPFYLAGLRAPRIGGQGHAERPALDALLASGTEFVIATPFQRTYAPTITALILASPERFHEIERRGAVCVYRVVRNADRPIVTPAGAAPSDRSAHPPEPPAKER